MRTSLLPPPFVALLTSSVQFFKAYLLPILSVLVALLANTVIAPYVSVLPPFLAFLAAVIVTAWYGGFASSVFTIALSSVVVDYFFIPPLHTFALTFADASTMALFIVEAVAMGYCIDYLRKNEARLQRANVDLHDQIALEKQRLLQREQKLHALTLQLAVTEERERQQLAAELHDYLAQLLTLVRMKVKQARVGVSAAAPQSDQYLAHADELVGKSLDYVRTLMAELYPVQLSQAGLPAAIRWIAGQMPRHGLEVDVFIQDEEVPISGDRARLLYQSVRELLMNIVKHAAVSRAVVSLDLVSNEVVIKVRDKGRGFDPSSVQQGHAGERFGLSSVRDRMVSIGGKFALESASGRGTTVTMSLPIQQFPQPVALRAASASRTDRVVLKPSVSSEQETLPLQ
jgi:signal transduction histidine kinase